jgi:hypothetical protein
MIPYVAFEDENEWDLAAKAFGSLPKLSKSSFKEDPKDVDATCQHAGWGTPQRDADGSTGAQRWTARLYPGSRALIFYLKWSPTPIILTGYRQVTCITLHLVVTTGILAQFRRTNV